MAPRKVGNGASKIVKELPEACRDEAKAVEFMERQRWGQEPRCPRCGEREVYQMRDRQGTRSKRFLWRCRACSKQFTVRIGTVFEDSRIPLRHWCFAFWAACASKKGVSALQISRMTGLSYKSALFMMHRIRFAMAPDVATPEKLSGTVEVDETYIGGKPRRRGRHNLGRYRPTHSAVVTMVQRDGRARSQTVTNVNKRNLMRSMRETIGQEAFIMTDSSRVYTGVSREFAGHAAVDHSKGEYVRGNAYTNTAESYFALLKRAIYGTYHNVSKAHLHRYLAQADFMWNTRGIEDGERTSRAIRSSVGKRLRYSEPKRTT